MTNRYALLYDSAAEGEIDTAVNEFQEKIIAIRGRHPKVGIGDTSTDEAIVAEIYRRIHGAFERIKELKMP